MDALCGDSQIAVTTTVTRSPGTSVDKALAQFLTASIGLGPAVGVHEFQRPGWEEPWRYDRLKSIGIHAR
jgi:hypothetical protein